MTTDAHGNQQSCSYSDFQDEETPKGNREMQGKTSQNQIQCYVVVV